MAGLPWRPVGRPFVARSRCYTPIRPEINASREETRVDRFFEQGGSSSPGIKALRRTLNLTIAETNECYIIVRMVDPGAKTATEEGAHVIMHRPPPDEPCGARNPRDTSAMK